MYMAMAAVRKASTERILDVACDIGVRMGIDAIGVRAVARQADISPSLISYHFKGRDVLLAALHEAIMRDHYADLLQQLDKVRALPGHMRSPSSFLTASISRHVHKFKPLTLLLLELRMHAFLLDDLVDVVMAWDFWREFGVVFDLPDRMIHLWAVIADAMLWYAILDDDPLVSQTWIGRALGRFAARLEGLPDHPVSTVPALPDVAAVSSEDGKQADDTRVSSRPQEITQAAIRLIARGEKISHRTIAKEAGLPLAATVYFFASKDDILADAYKMIYEMMIGDLRVVVGKSSQISILSDGRVAPIPALFGKLILHTARNGEGGALARRMRDARGTSSLKVLRQQGVDADRLDALVWSLSHGPYSPLIFGLPASERMARFDAHIADVSNKVFGLF